MNLFGDEIIRTLGLYQPFASLMLHGKIETRWCRASRKPPFPPGKYLLYSTKKPYNPAKQKWFSGATQIRINKILRDEPTRSLNGYAIAIGTLESVWKMDPGDAHKAFVEFGDIDFRQDKNGVSHAYVQECLVFTDIQRIEPFRFYLGKQGVGRFPAFDYAKIKIAS